MCDFLIIVFIVFKMLFAGRINLIQLYFYANQVGEFGIEMLAAELFKNLSTVSTMLKYTC